MRFIGLYFLKLFWGLLVKIACATRFWDGLDAELFYGWRVVEMKFNGNILK